MGLSSTRATFVLSSLLLKSKGLNFHSLFLVLWIPQSHCNRQAWPQARKRKDPEMNPGWEDILHLTGQYRLFQGGPPRGGLREGGFPGPPPPSHTLHVP